MGEGRAVDHALGWIVVDEHSFELIEKAVAVANPAAETASRASLLGGALQAIADIGVSARPFGGLAVGPPLDPRLERAVSAERGENPKSARRIVAGGDHVSHAQR